MTYIDAIQAAAELLADGASPEYLRGVVNLLAELYATHDQTVSERMVETERAIDAWPKREKRVLDD